jgi:hypothetical protein
MNKIVRKPIFWIGTAGVVGAMYLGETAGPGAGQGLNSGLTIIAIGGALALIILAIQADG